jgi:ABC-type Mn2+/Zn2+ transport system permease subunit
MNVADAAAFLALPFAASVLFVLIHAWFGVQVLRRNVIFADLALAQLSALGATIAFALGYAPTGPAGFAYALLFTAVGALLLTLSSAFSMLPRRPSRSWWSIARRRGPSTSSRSWLAASSRSGRTT